MVSTAGAGSAIPAELLMHRTEANCICVLARAGEVFFEQSPMIRPSRRLSMAQWDVFSSRPLEGNSLAVFFDGRGLSDDEMQSIAKEMNLSETTFVLPRDAATECEEGIRVRIFTVQEELPFAGHPTLGTAFALRGQSGAEKVVLELNVGKVPVHFEDAAGQASFG